MTLILCHSDVLGVLDRAEVFAAVERAHADLATGAASAPAPPATSLGAVAFIPMVATASSAAAAGVKMLSDVPGNSARGLPVQRSTIMVTSAETGECEALIDGRLITAVRTAAASAVATKHLARQDSVTLGLIGAGTLAVEHARAVATVLELAEIRVWSRSAATVDQFRSRTADLGVAVRAVDTPETVVRSSDVVCTLTPSRDPIVAGAWFGAGLHLNVVGAPPRPDHREVDAEAMRRARIVVDSTPTALSKSGDAVLAIADGAITPGDLDVELGDVISGRAPGRVADDDVTLYNSTGIGLQDLVTARLVIDRARALGVGTEVDLSR